MAEPIGPRITGMQHDVDEIRDRLESIANHQDGNQNVSRVDISAGGVGVWIAATACLVTLAASLFGFVIGAMWITREMNRMDARAAEQEVKIDRANTFLAAIWANAPELEKKIKAEQEQDSAE